MPWTGQVTWEYAESPTTGEKIEAIRGGQLRVTDVETLRLQALSVFFGAAGFDREEPVASEGRTVIQFSHPTTTIGQDWQILMLRAWMGLIAGEIPLEKFETGAEFGVPSSGLTITTTAGEASTTETNLAPLIIGAIVVGVSGVLAAVISYGLATHAEVTVRRIESDSRRKTLETTINAATKVVAAHHEREKEEQKTIEWDEGELKLMEALNKATAEATASPPMPLQSVPDLTSLAQGAGKGLEGLGKGAASAGAGLGEGFSWALPIAAAVGAYVYLN